MVPQALTPGREALNLAAVENLERLDLAIDKCRNVAVKGPTTSIWPAFGVIDNDSASFDVVDTSFMGVMH